MSSLGTSSKLLPKVESFASFVRLKVLFVEENSGEDIASVMFDTWSAFALIIDDKTNLSPCLTTSGYSKVTCRFGSSMFDCNAYAGMHMLKTSSEKTRLETFLNTDKFHQKWIVAFGLLLICFRSILYIWVNFLSVR